MTNTVYKEDWQFDVTKDYLGEYDKVNRRYSRLQIRSSLRSMCDHAHKEHESSLHYDMINRLEVINYNECFVDLTMTIDQVQWRRDYDVYEQKLFNKKITVNQPMISDLSNSVNMPDSVSFKGPQHTPGIVIDNNNNSFQTPECIQFTLHANLTNDQDKPNQTSIAPFSFRRRRVNSSNSLPTRWTTPQNMGSKRALSPDHVSYGSSPNPRRARSPNKRITQITNTEYIECVPLFKVEERITNERLALLTPSNVNTTPSVSLTHPHILLQDYCCLAPDNVIGVNQINNDIMDKVVNQEIGTGNLPISNIITRRQVHIEHVSAKWDITRQLNRHKQNLAKLLSSSVVYSRYSTWTNYKQLFNALEDDTAAVASAMAKCTNKKTREQFRQG
jgi:hypothetical protein